MKVLIVLSFLNCGIVAYAQNNACAGLNEKMLMPFNFVNGETEFNTDVKSYLDGISERSIIALGEGTHGTSEFVQIRSAVTKEMTSSHNVKSIFIENPFGNTFLLNKELLGDWNIDSIMKSYLLSIYQTAEFKDFLLWFRQYNKTHDRKISLIGLDHIFINAAARILKSELDVYNDGRIGQLTDSLVVYTRYQDSIWRNMNDPSFKYGMVEVVTNAVKIYQIVEKTKQRVKDLKQELSNSGKLCALNILQGVDALYKPSYGFQTFSRDRMMADLVIQYFDFDSSKAIVLAHNAHVAKVGAFDKRGSDTSMGWYLSNHFNLNYYVIGTFTAAGSYSATMDRFDNNSNIYSNFQLSKPSKKSWENCLAEIDKPVFLLPLSDFKNISGKSHRLVGYNPESASKSTLYSSKPIGLMYDAMIFFRNTHATSHDL